MHEILPTGPRGTQRFGGGILEGDATDISRFFEQISDLQRLETESMAGIEQMEQELAAVEATLAEELKIYNQIKASRP